MSEDSAERKKARKGHEKRKHEKLEKKSLESKSLEPDLAKSTSNIPWTKKYQPKTSHEIVGQNSQISIIKEFLNDFRNREKKAIILYGASGTGKTCSIYAIANENSWEVLEINASDFRNSEQIQAILGNAAKQASLFARQKILLVDEIDGLAGKEDRGGISALAKIISETSFPIVMTVGFHEDPKTITWNSKFNGIKKKSILVKFEKVLAEEILKLLKEISEQEKLKVDEEVLRRIARSSGGDVRAAVTDLETFAQQGCKKDGSSLGVEDAKDFLDTLGNRRIVEQMPKALIRIFRSLDPQIAADAFDSVDEDIDAQILWIDENLPKEYTNPEDLARAYEMLSKADVFRGRIHTWQHWGFLRTINLLITAGIAVSKDKKLEKAVSYKQSKRLLKIWMANRRYQLRKEISKKFAAKNHCSTRKATSIVPYLKHIFRANKKMAEAISSQLQLEEDEIEWLKR